MFAHRILLMANIMYQVTVQGPEVAQAYSKGGAYQENTYPKYVTHILNPGLSDIVFNLNNIEDVRR